MESIWMGIAAGAATRILAMAGPGETLLKGLLRGTPSHPRALPTLLEAVALWQGVPVRAVLCADERAVCGVGDFRDLERLLVWEVAR
jgi:hypothetical protein